MENIRQNILNWYPFKENSTILQISIDCDEITRYLCDISKKVTTIELSKERKQYILNNIKRDNLEVIEGNLEDIKLKEKYDYVILIGTLEYAQFIMKNNKNPELELLKFCKDNLELNGTILLSVDNRLGVKYLSGGKSSHCENIYDSIRNKFSNGKLFSKKELDKLIQKIEIKNKRYFYPLPNYKMPNIIISEDNLIKSTDSKLNYNFIYEEGSLVVQDEIKLLKQFIDNNEFEEYTNSYLVELSDSELNRDIKYISFNNMRKDEYSLILKMYSKDIEKMPKTQLAYNHILQINENCKKLKELGFEIAEDIKESNYIKSKYINLNQLDKYIVELIENEKIDEVYNLIDKWYEYIKKILKADENGNVEYGFLDLVFENTFYDDENDKFIIFDQEWVEKNINIDFILYRTIKNLFAHNNKIEQILDETQVMERYNLQKKQEEYEQMEKEFQDKIIDEEKRKFYGEQYKYRISSEELIKIIKDREKLGKDNVELISQINKIKNEREEELKLQEEKLQKVKNTKESIFSKIIRNMSSKK